MTHPHTGLVIGLDRPAEVRVEEGKSVNVTVRVLEGSLEEDAELLVGLSAISGTARGLYLTLCLHSLITDRYIGGC